MSILLATTNDRKIREARAACEQFDIEVVPIKLDIAEIQSADPQEIGKDKVEKAFALANKPIVVTDTSWNIPALKEFWGEFSSKPRGVGNSIEQIAVFNGATIAENRDKGKLSHDPEDYIWFDFAKWFSKK